MVPVRLPLILFTKLRIFCILSIIEIMISQMIFTSALRSRFPYLYLRIFISHTRTSQKLTYFTLIYKFLFNSNVKSFISNLDYFSKNFLWCIKIWSLHSLLFSFPKQIKIFYYTIITLIIFSYFLLVLGKMLDHF